MAENKKKVIVYADWIHIFEKLKDAEAGKLIKHFFRYINDENPVAPNRLTELTFEPIKQTLKRDLVAYNEKKSKNSESAKKRWNAVNDANASERIKPHAKHADSGNGSVTDSGSVNGTDTVKKKNVGIPAPEYASSIPTAKDFVKIEILKKEFVEDEFWMEDACRDLESTREEIIIALDKFERELRGNRETLKTRKDFAYHFRNLFRKTNGKIIYGNSSKTTTGKHFVASSAAVPPVKSYGAF